MKVNHGDKGKKKERKEEVNPSNKKEDKGKQNFPLSKHYRKKGHPSYKCWKKLDVKCNKCKQLGHIAKICKNKPYQTIETQVLKKQEEK